MFTSILGAISALGTWGQAIASFFGYQTVETNLKNTPAMQNAAAAQADQDEADKIKRDIDAAHEGKPEALEKDEA